MKNRTRLPSSFKNSFLPANPISLSLTRSKIFILLVIIFGAGSIFFLRLNNQNEIDMLTNKHREIQSAVEKYLDDMSHVKINSDAAKYFERKIQSSKKELKTLEDSIKQIKTIWFME